MKGIICQDIGKWELRTDLPEPVRGNGEAIVQVRRIGICGTDMHAYRGQQPFFTYPRILGHELSGTIVSVGENEQGLREGDAVSLIPYLHCGRCIACRSGKTNCCTGMQVMGVHVDGGMRERIAVPVTHLIKAEGLSFDEAAVVEPLAIGAHAVRRSGVTRGQTVLVIGAGPIGLGVMAFAKLSGATVLALDMNEERLAFCRSWAKADEAVTAGRPDTVERIRALTNGEFPEIVFDATGNAASMEGAFGLVAHGGTLVYVGLVKGELRFSDPEFHKREMTLMGSRNATLEDFDRVRVEIASGALDLDSYLTHRCRFEELPERFETWLTPEAKVIKAVVELD